MMSFKRCTVLAAFLLLPAAVMAQDILVSSVFDRRSAAVGEEIHLTIRVTGSRGNVPAPRLPAFQGFDTFYTGRASHLTFVNGVSSSVVEFSYVLVARQAGKFTLQPIEMQVEQRLFRTDPIVMEITAAQTAASPQAPVRQAPVPSSPSQQLPPPSSVPVPQAPPVSSPSDDNIFIQAWVDKTSVYPNEQILLSYSLYTRYDTRYEGFEEEPAVSGFWIEEFPMERNVQRETVRLNGKRYVKADVRRMALFPTAVADYTIRPGKIKVSIRQEPRDTSIFDDFFSDSFFSGGSFFARRENRLLEPPPIQVMVKPFPEQGKPKGFEGAVGTYRMTASLDRNAVKQNEPVTLKILLEGEGNIETLNKPYIPELTAFKVYDADSSSEIFRQGAVVGGRKSFEIVFIPTEAGTLTIPPLEFSYFDPRKETYEVLHTSSFPIQVEASTEKFEVPRQLNQPEVHKKGIELEGRDIHFIRERLPSERFVRILDGGVNTLAGLNGFVLFLFLFGLWRRRTESIFAKDTALRRRRLARQNAMAGMRKLSRKKEPLAYFEEIDRILTQYLTDKFDLSTYGGTRQDISRELEQTLGPEDALYRGIVALYELCDESRFGLGKVAESHKAEALKILRQTIARVEKVRR